jgi:hypothetical protein
VIPISDDNPTSRRPIVTIGLLVAMGAVWIFVQGAGFDAVTLATSVCNWGMVPGELTGRAAIGTAVPMGPGLVCIVDAERRNFLTPLTSLFLGSLSSTSCVASSQRPLKPSSRRHRRFPWSVPRAPSRAC